MTRLLQLREDENIVVVETNTCDLCGKSAVVEITGEEFAALHRGVLIQNALPNRDASFRELFKTGYHEHCWNTLFPPGDDED